MTDVVLTCRDEGEGEALGWVLQRLPAGYRAIVVDTGSSDASVDIATWLGARVVRAPQPGFGAAAHAGLCAATAELVCFLDADGSSDPAQLPRLVQPVREGAADLVLGRRRPTSRRAWPVHARAGNAVMAGRLRRACGVPLRDLGPMRAARREALLSLALSDRQFGYPLEMVVKAARAGWRVREVDVDYAHRSGGSLRGTLRTVAHLSRVLSR